MPKFLNQQGVAPIIIIIIVGVAIMLIGVGVYNNSDCVKLTERSENRNISSCIINYLSGITKKSGGNGLSNPGSASQNNQKSNTQNNSKTQSGLLSNQEVPKKPLSCDSLSVLPSSGWSENSGNESDTPYEKICDDILCGSLGIVDGANIGGKFEVDRAVYGRGSTRQKAEQGTEFSCGMSFGSSKSFEDTISWYKSKIGWMGSAQEETQNSDTGKQSRWVQEKCYGGKVYHYTITVKEIKDTLYNNPVEVKLGYEAIPDKDQVGHNKPVGAGCITSEEKMRRFQNSLQDILNSK